MGDAENTTTDATPRVKHDWTFFVFITVALLLIAAAISWVSAKSTIFSQDVESTTITQPSP